MNVYKNTLLKIKNFFEINNVNFWLEAGTALAAYRDNKIFDWDHDLDIAIWRTDVDKILNKLNKEFKSNFDIIIQKKLPYIDNIIQLKSRSNSFVDVDIYLYTIKDNYCYMRWIHKPEGKFSYFQVKSLILFSQLYQPRSLIFKFANSLLITELIKKIIYSFFLKIYLKFNSCIYHEFPKIFFLNLKKINLYGLDLNIPEQTENYLEYRYGENWNIKDRDYNQSGKWKKSKARKMLKMNIIDSPEIKKINFNE